MAACLSWIGSANLPFSFVAVTLGLELVLAGPQVARFQQRILQWGRRLRGWPHGSPSLVVQGLARRQHVRLCRAASLWARLLNLPCGCVAGQPSRLASQQLLAWVTSIANELGAAGVLHPADWGNHSCPLNLNGQVSCRLCFRLLPQNPHLRQLSRKTLLRFEAVLPHACMYSAVQLGMPKHANTRFSSGFSPRQTSGPNSRGRPHVGSPLARCRRHAGRKANSAGARSTVPSTNLARFTK